MVQLPTHSRLRLLALGFLAISPCVNVSYATTSHDTHRWSANSGVSDIAPILHQLEAAEQSSCQYAT